MKNTAIIFFACLATFTLFSCGESGTSNKGITFKGTLEGASGLTVYLDKVGVNPASANTVIGKTTADASGAYTLHLDENLNPGLYRIRAGAQRVSIVLDGKEHLVTVNGDLGKLNNFDYSLAGSASSATYQSMMKKLAARQVDIKGMEKFVDTTANAITAMAVAVQSLGNNNSPQFMNIHHVAQRRMKTSFPGSELEKEYLGYVAGLKKVKGGGKGYSFIEEGERQPAPDIILPSPDGKEYALSDLKGQVVLLDFWASWCGPCRRENPNVVRIYDQYKDKGFTVFSVSLDGMDSRTASRFGGDEKKKEQYLEQQKQRWVDAIKKDQLKWDYHVSDLKKWECAPARAYGVSSIPRTFMIDKEGRIAAMNLRGEAIEDTLLKLL